MKLVIEIDLDGEAFAIDPNLEVRYIMLNQVLHPSEGRVDALAVPYKCWFNAHEWCLNEYAGRSHYSLRDSYGNKVGAMYITDSDFFQKE